MKNRRNSGFTLIEVLVALGIAGGALILVLSANNESLKRSIGARQEVRLERAVESKFEECLLGLEPATTGGLPGLPRWHWEIRRTVTHVAGLRKLRRVSFVVTRPDGSRALLREVLQYPEVDRVEIVEKS